MVYQPLNVREGSHDPWPDLDEHRRIDPYRHDKAVEVVRELAERLGLEQPAIVDFGCGDGVTLGRLFDAGFRSLCGIDHSAEGIARTRRKALGVFVVGDLTEVETVAFPCDIAICTEVLEHLPHDADVARVMRLLFATVRSGGYAYISIPDDSICGIDDDHRRLFTPEDPVRLLEAAGFVDVEEIRYHYSADFPWPWMMAVGRRP